MVSSFLQHLLFVQGSYIYNISISLSGPSVNRQVRNFCDYRHNFFWDAMNDFVIGKSFTFWMNPMIICCWMLNVYIEKKKEEKQSSCAPASMAFLDSNTSEVIRKNHSTYFLALTGYFSPFSWYWLVFCKCFSLFVPLLVCSTDSETLAVYWRQRIAPYLASNWLFTPGVIFLFSQIKKVAFSADFYFNIWFNLDFENPRSWNVLTVFLSTCLWHQTAIWWNSVPQPFSLQAFISASYFVCFLCSVSEILYSIYRIVYNIPIVLSVLARWHVFFPYSIQLGLEVGLLSLLETLIWTPSRQKPSTIYPISCPLFYE